MNYRWILAPSQNLLCSNLTRELNISSLTAQCLVNRGLDDAEMAGAFLSPKLKNLSDPFLIPQMRVAVDRLLQARKKQEPLVVFGDYDVDGVTSTALLLEVFERLGWKAQSYLPHRMDEGYGLGLDAVENCLRRHSVPLILAVDCGSTAVEAIRLLRSRGVDVIVLDHHQVSDPRPAAVALVNPQLAAEHEKSFRELCSVGLAFKLAHALVKVGREQGWPAADQFDLRPLLDLVALGTIADLVPLTGENRILVSTGLGRLEQTSRAGLIALKAVAKVEGAVGVYEVGFQLAPRLNAAGRVEDATLALDLLTSRNPAEAHTIAQQLDSHNRERQQIERNIADEVLGALKAKFDPARDYVIVEGQLLWHIGVVGIVASRVLREFYRPTLILGGDGKAWRGSGRSIEGFDLAAALRECSDLLVRHGGHAMAAGLTIEEANVDKLRERLNALARRTLIGEMLRPKLRLDAEVRAGELTGQLVEELRSLEPFGQGNPGVQLQLCQVRMQRQPQRMGKDSQHLKMWVTDGRQTLEAVWWNYGQRTLPENVFDLACAPQVNEYNGRRTVQLKVLDWRQCPSP